MTNYVDQVKAMSDDDLLQAFAKAAQELGSHETIPEQSAHANWYTALGVEALKRMATS